MAVGPQYQSQLALLAGALGHGLDPTQGLQMYQSTLDQAAAARAQRQQEIQATLAALTQTAQQQAEAGASPDSVKALVKSTAAGLPRSGAPAVQQGIHGILGHLADYQAPVDPMAQAQLQGQLLQNAQAQQDLSMAGNLDVSKETVYGPAHQQEVATLTNQYLASGASVPEIRSRIVNQVMQDFAPTMNVPVMVKDPQTGKMIPDPTGKTASQQVPIPGVAAQINSDISATIAQSTANVGTTGLTGQQWVGQNLVNYGYSPPGTPGGGAPAAPSPQQVAVNAIGQLGPSDVGVGSSVATPDYWKTIMGLIGQTAKTGLF